MSSAQIGPPIITAVSTLTGVSVTLWVAGRRESRRAALEQERETQRIAEQHWQWNRSKRLEHYAALIHAASQLAAQFHSSSHLVLQRKMDVAAIDDHYTLLDRLTDDLRIQVHLVSLIGSEAMIEEAYSARRRSRHAAGQFSLWANALIRGPHDYIDQEQVDNAPQYFNVRIRAMYDIVNELVDTAQGELHPDSTDEQARPHDA